MGSSSFLHWIILLLHLGLVGWLLRQAYRIISQKRYTSNAANGLDRMAAVASTLSLLFGVAMALTGEFQIVAACVYLAAALYAAFQALIWIISGFRGK